MDDATANKPPIDVLMIGVHAPNSLAAAALARAGFTVVLVSDRSQLAVPEGNTTVPYTSELFELIADRFDLPEVRKLALFSTGPEVLRRSSGRKECLSFAHLDSELIEEDLQFVVPSEHEEWHLDRRELDHWALDQATRAGVEVATTDRRPDLAFDESNHVWQVQLPTCRTARFLIDGSSVTNPEDLALLGARRVVDDPTWATVQIRLRTTWCPHGYTPRVPHAVPWDRGTTLVASRYGLAQLASTASSIPGMVNTIVWATVQKDCIKTDPLEMIRVLFGELDPVLDLLEREIEVRQVLVDDAFVHVEQREDLPVLLWERAAGSSAQVLSRDITQSLETMCTVLPHLMCGLRSPDNVDVPTLIAARNSITDVHTRWARTALECRGAWSRWNAFLRVWLLWTIMGALSIKRERLNALEIGWSTIDDRVGPWWYALPTGLVELMNDSLHVLDTPIDATCAVELVFRRLRTDRIVPPLFDFGDPTAKSYRFTPTRRLRMLLWATVLARGEMSRLVTSDNVTGRTRTLDSVNSRSDAVGA